MDNLINFKKIFVLCLFTVFAITYLNFNEISNYRNISQIASHYYYGSLSPKLVKDVTNTTKLPNIKINHLTSGKIIFDQSYIRMYGYCNNVYSLLSAFTIALLEQRQLQVYWPQITKYIQKPSAITFISNATIERLKSTNNYSMYKPHILYPWERYKNLTLILNDPVDFPREKKFVIYSSIVAYFFEVCAKPMFYDRLLTMGLVEEETIEKAREVIKAMNVTKNEQAIDLTYKLGKFGKDG